MPSSGYTAITFVANEQPTTAKWNLIGSNDSSFNLGTGLEDGVIINRHLGAASVSNTKLDATAILLGTASRTTTMSGFSAETQITSTTVTVPSTSRSIEVEINIPQVYSSVATDRVTFRLKEDGVLIQQSYGSPGATAGNGGWFGKFGVIKAVPSAGSHTYSVTVERDTGSGTLTLYASVVSANSTMQLNVKLV